MSLSPYLNFAGTCGPAFDLYRSVFGGEFMARMTFAEGPEDMPKDPETADWVMHVALPVGDVILMGSDCPPAFGGAPVHGSGCQICYTASSREDAEEKFAALSDGGQVLMPMADMFWGDYFGQVVDPYGQHWMISFNAGVAA